MPCITFFAIKLTTPKMRQNKSIKNGNTAEMCRNENDSEGATERIRKNKSINDRTAMRRNVIDRFCFCTHKVYHRSVIFIKE